MNYSEKDIYNVLQTVLDPMMEVVLDNLLIIIGNKCQDLFQ